MSTIQPAELDPEIPQIELFLEDMAHYRCLEEANDEESAQRLEELRIWLADRIGLPIENAQMLPDISLDGMGIVDYQGCVSGKIILGLHSRETYPLRFNLDLKRTHGRARVTIGNLPPMRRTDAEGFLERLAMIIVDHTLLFAAQYPNKDGSKDLIFLTGRPQRLLGETIYLSEGMTLYCTNQLGAGQALQVLSFDPYRSRGTVLRHTMLAKTRLGVLKITHRLDPTAQKAWFEEVELLPL